MQKTLTTLALAALLLAAPAGCGAGRNVQRGIDQYDRADYASASAEFTDLSPDEGAMNNKGLVRYLVYRGLTFYHLGQRPQAYGYLVRGKTAYDRGTKGWLKGSIVAEMDTALADLSHDPAVTAGPPLPVTPAPAATPAAPPPATTAPGKGPTIIIVNGAH
jgi:hypothetical protein